MSGRGIKPRVLVFPCGSEIGLELHRSLGSAKEITLFGASSVADHGEFVYKNYITGIPYVHDPRFLRELNRVIKKFRIDHVIPAHDGVIPVVAAAYAAKKLACRPLTPPYGTCRICYSKKLTSEVFAGTVPAPKLFDSLSRVKKWPVFLKPEHGCGSKGAVKCATRAEAAYHLRRSGDLLIFEYLPGREYTVDCFTDRLGRLLFCGGRERLRVSNGISVRTAPVRRRAFRAMARAINERLPMRGAWFFQVRENGAGEPALMEIGPRIAGAMGLYRNLGINFALMSLYDAEGRDISLVRNDYPILLDRSLVSRFRTGLKYTRAYIDWDDCLLLRGKLNLRLVAFLYQCVNNGIPAVLLTRHAGNLQAALKKHRLERVFSSVIRIRDGAPKSAFIKERRAILIDDSFAERAEVARNSGIPVFAPDAVESLLDL